VLVHPDLLPATPTLFVAESANPRKSARLGEKVTVTGIRLAGTGARARLMHRLLTAPYEIGVTPNATGTGFELTLPNTVAAQTALPAGTWQLSLVLTPTGETDERETNGVPLLISAAPVFTAIGAPLNLPKPNVVRQTSPAAVRVTLATRPRIRPEQTAILMLGAVQATANPRKVITDPLVFVFPGTLPAGNHPARLRVDGVDSELILVQPNKAPVYDPAQRVSVP
jgi:hypothetical protein